MTRLSLAAYVVLPLLAGGGCAPKNTDTTYSDQDVGRAAQIRTGVIVSMRPVAVHAENSGIGAFGGGALGGVAGSFLGGPGNVGVNILGAVGGALLGGLGGNAIEGASGKGQAVEFIIHADDGETISVVQTNELQLQPGEHVVMTLGARTRLARAVPLPAAAPPPVVPPGI